MNKLTKSELLDRLANKDFYAEAMAHLDSHGLRIYEPKVVAVIVEKGGTGSGHHGHAGIPGKHGGSLPGTGSRIVVSTESERRERYAKLWRKKALDGRIGPTKKGKAPPLRDYYEYNKSDERAENVINSTHDLGYGHDWQDASSDTRGKVKNAIVTKLSTDTGLEYDQVNNGISIWAHTSNDENAYALQMQRAAADEFGLELSEWQSNKINTISDSVPAWVGATMDANEQRLFMRTMYANTQANFAEHGFGANDTITLYRGFNTTEKNASGFEFETRELVPHLGQVVNWEGNAIESWSSSKSVAGNFGKNMIAMEVPIRNIIGSCVTGFGCLNEAEFVVFGTTGSQARLIRAGNYNVGEKVPEYVLTEIAEGKI